MKYRVLWLGLWKEQTTKLSILLFTVTSIVFLARYINSEKNIQKTFEHISILQWPILIVGLSLIIAFIIATVLRMTCVEIVDDQIIGRNYWFFKKIVPITAIKRIYTYNNTSLTVIVIDGGDFGEIHISNHLENLDELIHYLEDAKYLN